MIMASVNDLREACYTSPSGKKFYFEYDSKLGSETDLKTATFTFPDRDGALVVPLGLGGRRFSFSCNFFGSRCLKQANEFEDGLKERGYGELVHPLYGVHKVVPTGSISRSDDVVAGINISSVSVTFAETLIDVDVINSEVVSEDEIDSKMDEYEEKSTWEYVKDFVTDRVQDAIWAANMLRSGLNFVAQNLQKIANFEKKILSKFNSLQNELFSSIDNIVSSIDDVAMQTIKLIRLPANAAINASAKVEGYAAAARGIIRNFKNDPANITNAKNQWAATRLMLQSLIVACAGGVAVSISKSNLTLRSREEAVRIATDIAELYDEIIEFEEKNIGKDFFVETGEGYNSMRDVVSMSIQHIIECSFSLPNRKSIILGEDRQIIELVYELYGNLDKLDEFIIDNNLNYNEIEVIPMGREVAYYV